MVGRGGMEIVCKTYTEKKILRELPLCGRTDDELFSLVLWVILGFLNFLLFTHVIGVMKNTLNKDMIIAIHFSE